MRNKFLVSVVSAMLSISLLLTGCGSKKGEPKDSAKSKEDKIAALQDPNVNPPGQYPIVKEKITLTIGMPQKAQVKDPETNEFTKWLEEKSNIDLKFEMLPEKDANQKLQIMVAGGSKLPDVINGIELTSLEVVSLVNQKALKPLNDYYDNFSTNTQKMFDSAQNKNLKKVLTMPDGNIYSIPKHVESLSNNLSLRSWINKAWLDKLGLKMPTTTDEFYEVLKAFKTMDPNGNGKADEIAFVGSNKGWRQQPWDYVMNAFIYNDTVNRYILKDGKVDVAFNKKEWQDGLKYMKKLASEKLLSDLSFTQDQKQLQQIAGAPGPSTIGVLTAGGTAAVFPANDKRLSEYAPLPPLKGPAGVQWAAFYPSPVHHMYIITKDCANPLAAFRLGDLMLSEESSLRSRWGVPEVDWKVPAANEKGMYDALGIKARVKPILQWGSVQNSHWQESNPTFRPSSLSEGQVFSGNVLDGEYLISQSVPLYMNKSPKDLVGDLVFTEEEASEVATIRNNINTYVVESIARFVTGDRNIDTDWNAYVKEFEALELNRYLEITQKAYDRMYKK